MEKGKINKSVIYDRDAKCPYYKGSDGVHIKCEGLIPNTSIMLSFGNRTDKGIYFRNYCACDMNKCEVCKILNRRYGVSNV